MLDKTIRDGACFYCGRRATLRWPSGAFSCHDETCKSLSHARDMGLLYRAGKDRPAPERVSIAV